MIDAILEAGPLATAPPDPAPPPITLASLFGLIGRATVASFGGGVAGPAMRRELVRRRGWLTDEAWLELYGLGQLMPGPTIFNVAVLLGLRLYGTIGALVGWIAATLPSLAVIAVMAILVVRGSAMPLVHGALAGAAAGAAGLMVANAIELTIPRRHAFAELAVIAAAALGITVFRLPLVATLVVLLPISFLIARRGAASC